jgi:hypothetical protein
MARFCAIKLVVPCAMCIASRCSVSSPYPCSLHGLIPSRISNSYVWFDGLHSSWLTLCLYCFYPSINASSLAFDCAPFSRCISVTALSDPSLLFMFLRARCTRFFQYMDSIFRIYGPPFLDYYLGKRRELAWLCRRRSRIQGCASKDGSPESLNIPSIPRALPFMGSKTIYCTTRPTPPSR